MNHWAYRILIALLPLFVGVLGMPLSVAFGGAGDAFETCELNEETVEAAEHSTRREKLRRVTPTRRLAWRPKSKSDPNQIELPAQARLDCWMMPLRC